MTNAVSITEWDINTSRDGRRWVASASRGRETVWAGGKTKLDAEAAVKTRLREGGYAA